MQYVECVLIEYFNPFSLAFSISKYNCDFEQPNPIENLK